MIQLSVFNYVYIFILVKNGMRALDASTMIYNYEIFYIVLLDKLNNAIEIYRLSIKSCIVDNIMYMHGVHLDVITKHKNYEIIHILCQWYETCIDYDQVYQVIDCIVNIFHSYNCIKSNFNWVYMDFDVKAGMKSYCMY